MSTQRKRLQASAALQAVRHVHIHGLRLTWDPAVYEPAEDTELLALVVNSLPDDALRSRTVVEVGTGTGLIACLLARRGAKVAATDLNPAACRLARENAKMNGLAVDVVQTDLLAALRGPFDLIVSNPPYLPTETAERGRDAIELALDGGESGVEPAMRLLDQAAPRLAPDGRVLFVASSAAALDVLDAHALKTGWIGRVVDRDPLGLETLMVFEATRRRQF